MTSFYPDLKGKATLVLGASRGIGASAAEALAAAGARLVISSRDVPALEALAAKIGKSAEVHVVKADLGKPDDVRSAVAETVKKFGRLDVAVNNAGVTHSRTAFADIEDDVFDATFNVNARGIFVAMKAQIKAMLASGGGSIVNTGSIGSFVGMKDLGAYTASKHAMAGMTKVAALDHGRNNIRVNLLAPGAVRTEMIRASVLSSAAVTTAVEGTTAIGRIADPIEMAGAILWLCSDASSYVTGAIIPVDGGYTIG